MHNISQVEDEELHQLIRQVMQNRKLEKDYRNIEDQIRCLKLRKFAQQQAVEEHYQE